MDTGTAFAESLSRNNTLKEIYFRGKLLFIVPLLCEASLSPLLPLGAGNELGTVGCLAMVEALRNNTSLLVLGLAGLCAPTLGDM